MVRGPPSHSDPAASTFPGAAGSRGCVTRPCMAKAFFGARQVVLSLPTQMLPSGMAADDAKDGRL